MPYIRPKETSRHDMTPEQRKQARRQQKRQYTLRKQGKPSQVLPHEFEAAKTLITKARAGGMSDRQIAAQIGCDQTTITKIKNGSQTGLNRTNHTKIMGLVFEPPGPKHTGLGATLGAHLDPTGTIRRLQALCAAGYTGTHLAPLLGMRKEELNRIALKPRAFVFATTHTLVADWYSKLQNADPTDHGVPLPSQQRAKTRARKHGWAPASCWDDDTIDNPEAIPEWTGRCGTNTGYDIHHRDHILPTCPPCRAARAAADRARAAAKAA